MIDNTSETVAAPTCLTWELTHACDLSCIHCSSSSRGRDPRELSTGECKALIDEFERMRICRVDIGGGEPTARPDFWELVDYTTAKHIGVKFSTNGIRITPHAARRIAGNGSIDVQICLDGATEAVNDAVRGTGAYRAAVRAMELLASSGVYGFELSVAVSRHNVGHLDALSAIADMFGARLRLNPLRPSGRGTDTWDELHPTADQRRMLDDWLREHDVDGLTGDSFFQLSGYGESLPGSSVHGAGPVMCLIDPVGDVYGLADHDRYRVGNIRAAGGFEPIWHNSELFTELRRPQSSGTYAEHIGGHGDSAPAGIDRLAAKPSEDYSHRHRPVVEHPAVRRSA
ncbi:mycofactocin radical SAM maturase [Nocardia vinacea]|uniref:Mycofactocin radical SAM maturase n=1 Tax=Nocardia vinacea TaxID=96468 RepID=A0ABZ1YWB6_9NOCA|nr:mycofactocin radical SAM maturase [Nocardia vinacea]